MPDGSAAMVAVVQLVEHQVVILAVAGSSPVSHPDRSEGILPSDRVRFDWSWHAIATSAMEPSRRLKQGDPARPVVCKSSPSAAKAYGSLATPPGRSASRPLQFHAIGSNLHLGDPVELIE